MAAPLRNPEALPANPEEDFQPKTPLGRRLWELRQEIIRSGEPLLDAEALEREVAERRGERRDLDD
jgi:hypothetical protein